MRVGVMRSALLCACLIGATALAQSSDSDCPPGYTFKDTMDYLDPDGAVQARIRGIEGNHLNPDVEGLVRGQSTANAGGDLRFILTIIPNHHRALHAMMRLGLREKKERLPEAGPYSVRCWLHRATVYNPNDGGAWLVYGIYIARLGQPREALIMLERADALLPDDINVNYNLGLVYVDLKDFARARERAKRAYAAGYPLPGLRQRLIQAGEWSE
jgi:tetratricopeptide (TPR) repeat protein